MTQTTWNNPNDEQLKAILSQAKTIAVVGCSPKEDRVSYKITAFLISKGYTVFPIHPKAECILGQKVYASLADVPQDIDIVNVFRKPESTPQIAEQAAAVGAKTIWLQQGIANSKTWDIAQQHHVTCIMDLCIAVMHRLLLR